MKISKASWMILGAGIFIIILAGLGMTRSGQLRDYDALSSNFTLLTNRLNNMPANTSMTEINEYQQQLADAQEQADAAKQKLVQSVISVDVSEKIYEIADYCKVIIHNLSTTHISSDEFSAIDCETINAGFQASGAKDDLINFVIALNNNFSTGFVRGVQYGFSDDQASVGVQMTVYTRKGN